ncbi:uncharacterized protein BJ212DRAFT_1474588 [Suillus subaureus]|uniref:Integrase core domain-containing protein n=1 Tax=Suillus subaureus TaxID=48587 RepID=A0A9P7EP71_9AGAM|nr:uncharacterized protein BJ212DRAFT_1474588 [Suillus subaureus]KAG1827436.1 hypothetical protein BJ212DRAFT_1474588 [Suillus subaureus]
MIQWQQYKVLQLNALWHMDGHHKLICWGIIIHGIIDGYCRTMVTIHPSTSNSAFTVLEVFLNAVTLYAEWNVHPISGEGHDQSPNDMRLMGQLKHGLYADNCEGVHPDIIRQYYGTAGRPIHCAPHQTGAGHPSDEVYSASRSTDGESDNEESEEEWEDINDAEDIGTEDLQELPQLIAADHNAHFYHKPVCVPKHASPFRSATLYNTFCQALDQVQEAEHIPDGFGILPHEWDDDEYPLHEIIQSG